MEVPKVDGWKVRNLLGSGICGQVFRVEDEEGRLMTVKLFQETAINRELLASTTEKLEASGWPAGVMPVLSADFVGFPPIRVNDWFGRIECETPRPSSLHHYWSSHSGAAARPVVLGIARALAGMHAQRVPHCNLKPGNVFFNAAGEVLLSDWSLGNMPDVAEQEFSDALLYQSPEQLRNPAGYLAGDAFRWDVFAFGVLAFRLMTGVFPRSHETFRLVAPDQGEPVREGIQAEVGKIARRLEGQATIVWPAEAAGPQEEVLREWIVRCLELDRLMRPQTMVEVLAGLEAAETGLVPQVGRGILLDQRRAAGHRASRAYFVAGGSLAAAVLLGGLWQFTNARVELEKSARTAEVALLRATVEMSRDVEIAAAASASEALQALAHEKERAQARLAESRMNADRVFSWAMEKGHRRLPPLDGRELRLRNLERSLEEFLDRTTDDPALDEERARVRLQLAEISLASGDPKLASSRLAEAVGALSGSTMSPDLRLRVAKDRLLLALLMQTGGDPETAKAFATARESLQQLPQAEVEASRLNQLLAVLDFHEAKLLAARGEDAAALEQLMRATKTLNRLAEQRPDSVVLRSELAACYLSSATILEGIGALGDARGARSLAAAELEKLIRNDPDNTELRMELAGSYGAMAESAVLSGDLTGADGYAQEAMTLLAGVLREQPENTEATGRMAAQLGLRADIMRDMGQTAEAFRTFDEAIRMIERVQTTNPGDPTTAFRLALLGWQKGKMLGTSGKRDEEITLLQKSRDLLLNLESEAHPAGPPLDQVQRSQAYLQGDLGHAFQLANRLDEAKEAFRQSVSLWEALAKSRPDSEEYEEGLAWCRQRLKELE